MILMCCLPQTVVVKRVLPCLLLIHLLEPHKRWGIGSCQWYRQAGRVCRSKVGLRWEQKGRVYMRCRCHACRCGCGREFKGIAEHICKAKRGGSLYMLHRGRGGQEEGADAMG